MHRRMIGVAALLLGALIFPAAHVTATGADIYQLRGAMADAYFTNTVGCVVSTTYVIANEAREKDGPGKPQAASTVEVFLHQYDTCTGEEDSIDAHALAAIPGDAFHISSMLDGATLQATVAVYDAATHATYPVELQVTWSGTGEVTKNKSYSHDEDGACKSNYRFKGSFRHATAEGSVTAPAAGFALAGSAQMANMMALKRGYSEVNCP